MRERSDAHKTILQSFTNLDERSFGVYNSLKEIYPAFAKKLFEGNFLMQQLVMSGYNGMDILDYSICGKCETLAPMSDPVYINGKPHKTCTCVAKGCGRKTIDPPTLRQWIREELKKKATPEVLDALEVVVDETALYMLYKWVRDTKAIIQQHNNTARHKMGIVDSNGEVIRHTGYVKPHIQHNGQIKPQDIPEDIELIQEDAQDD